MFQGTIFLCCSTTFTNFNIHTVIESDWYSSSPLSFNGREVVHTTLMDEMIVRVDQIFNRYNYTVFLCPGIVFHDQWGCLMTVWGNAGEFQYHIRQYFPFYTWIVARGDSHQTNPVVALIHWFTFPVCVFDVTGLMNIQGGLSRDYISRQMGRIITQNC